MTYYFLQSSVSNGIDINYSEFIASIIISAFTLAITAANLVISGINSKRSALSASIVTERTSWIKDVRKLARDFLVEFSYEVPDYEKLKHCYLEIELYFRPRKSAGIKLTEDYSCVYENIDDALKWCISDTHDTAEKKRIEDGLLCAFQELFSRVWARGKQEAGVSKRDNKKAEKETHKEYTRK